MIEFKRVYPDTFKGGYRGGEILSWYPPLNKQEYYVRDGTVYLACHYCGKPTCLKDHEISVTGMVSPSVVSETEGCNFHENVRLLNYKNFT